MAAIGADIQSGANVTPAEMEAYFLSLASDGPAEASSSACPTCSAFRLCHLSRHARELTSAIY